MTEISDDVWAQMRDACTDHMLATIQDELPPVVTSLPDVVTVRLARTEPILRSFREGGEEGVFPLGTYKPKRSPGTITLYLDNLGGFFWHIVKELLARTGPLTREQIRQLADATAHVTFLHERFHHFCDLARKDPKALDSPREEGLAVAMSWYGLHFGSDAYTAISQELWDAFVDIRFDYRCTGYKNWSAFSHCHVFADEVDRYLALGDRLKAASWRISNRSNPYSAVEGLYSLSEWNVQSVDFDFIPQPECHDSISAALATVRTTEGSPKGRPFPDSAQFNSRQTPHIPPRATRRDIHWCDLQETSLPLEGIQQKFKNLPLKNIDGTLCLYGAPVCSHVLSLFFSAGLRRVVLFHRDIPELSAVSAIVNKHLGVDAGSNKDKMVDCQHELIEEGFEDYAQLQ